MSSTPASWAHEKERSNLWVLRVMRWIAVAAGRPIARLVLHPITLYFLVANAKARRESARYLTRALKRPARWADVYRHIHHFAATILDRVYFLQERFDAFDVRSTGATEVHALLGQGEGVMLAGAHFGSFEAMPNGPSASAVPTGTCQTIWRVFTSMAVSVPCGGCRQGANTGLSSQSFSLL